MAINVAAPEVKSKIERLLGDVEPAHQDLGGPAFHAWMTRADTLIASLGGVATPVRKRFDDLQDEKHYDRAIKDLIMKQQMRADTDSLRSRLMLQAAEGIIRGLEQSIDDGLLSSVEDRVASAVYSDVFEEALSLLNANHFACAAILCRVGLENGLRRRALREYMPGAENAKASALNQWLWKEGNGYPRATFEAVEGWLAIGNDFAHNTADASKYTQRDVARAIGDVQSFLGTLLA